MKTEKIPFDIINSFPPVDQKRADNLLSGKLSLLNKKIIVLDDDPTGIQTVHGVSVYTGWDKSSVENGFNEQASMFFILTNSRSFTNSETIAKHKEICENIFEASLKAKKEFIIVSRGDSTLRGHYPDETETIKTKLGEYGKRFDGEIIYPFFPEGGRYTINNVHYVKDGESLVPVGETEFARDKTFGFQSSVLTEWIEEKTHGKFKRVDVTCISLMDLRTFNIDKITEQLMSVKDFGKVIVNSADYADVKVFCAALIQAMLAGKEFVFRVAAGFTKIIGGVPDKPLLTKKQLISDNNNGGLIIVGSHVKRTTEQLNVLNTLEGVTFIEFDQHLVLKDGGLESEVVRVAGEINRLLPEGKTVAVYTRRDRLDLGAANKEEELIMATRISSALTNIVTRLEIKPGFLIAKGGITSSDIGTTGLRVNKATVAGQIKPGVPVWLTGPESKFPNMGYVIFPGNVGTASTLYDIVKELM